MIKTFQCYFVAVFSTGVAFWITRELNAIISPPLPFPFFFLAVMVSAWWGGLGPALTSMTLGLLLSQFDPSSLTEFYLGTDGLLHLAVFALISVLITLLAESRRRNEQNFKVLLASIGDAVVTTDSRGKILFMNEPAQAITKWKLSDARKKKLTEVFRLKNVGEGVVEAQLSQVLHDRKPAAMGNGARLVGSSGSFLAVDGTMRPVIDMNGRASGVLVIFRDITGRLELENARESARERAEFLANSLEMLAVSFNPRMALANLCRLSVPILADWCGVWIITESGKPELVSLRHRDPRMEIMLNSTPYQNDTDHLLEKGISRLIRSGNPVFYSLNRKEQECREYPELLRIFRELDLHSAVVTPIQSRKHTAGVLALGRTGKSREYDETDLSFAIDLGSRTAVLLENINLVENLQRTLRERELLLREVHHRVKNNLQVISSLLSLRSRSPQSRNGNEFFEECNLRIKAMARVHEMLISSEDLTQIDFSEYARRLATGLNQSFHSEDRVEMQLNLQPCPLDVSTSVTLGLVLNEIISNSLKHAFPAGSQGKIQFELQRIQDGITIEVRDNGAGVCSSDSQKREKFGLRLVDILVSQLGGTFQFRSGSAGTSFQLHLRSNRTPDAALVHTNAVEVP